MNRHFQFPFEKNKSFSYSPESIEKLSEYEKYELSFHPERPKYLDYLSIFESVSPCFESDDFGACLIQTHRGELDGIPVMLLGQQSGPSSNYEDIRNLMMNPDQLQKWNHGMPVPSSYERAVKAIHVAEEEKRIILIFIDTPGADPTEQSESNGIAWRIGDTIHALADVKVPTISIIINRACSGGAIALTGTDLTLALENSTYLVISPEACSSILFHTRSRANEAAEISQITSREGLAHGIVDELIPEPNGPAHINPEESKKSVQSILKKYVNQFSKFSGKSVIANRIERWNKIGYWDRIDSEELYEFHHPKSRIPNPKLNGYIPRHKKCYTKNGNHQYDPVLFSSLTQSNFVCDVCGHRYVRPSAWDYINWMVDTDSFFEHEETKFIVDKDILAFPGYIEKLEIARMKTGLATAMITGNGTILGKNVVLCTTDFGFLGGSFCMSTGEKVWRAAQIAIDKKIPMIFQACGGGARMHEGCSSMVSIPKAQLAMSRVEQAGLPVVTLITDPTLGGVAIGIASRGQRIFEYNAGHIGFSGKRVIEQYTGEKTSQGFQTVDWLHEKGHADEIVHPKNLKEKIFSLI
ncbi:MAG: acetyl-CoA carboxylase carboxyl transferase subunit alpha/beta [Candidatus Marinimicrobia bacterium]|jgi:acetyl-CoA carboxylase beta subunit|nr:acetyl-CoA carboxylase carboxyl transferase subunit alpha/beta [Candidatus Neomarinimicrobiota bacterium]MBT3838970.1 acetyl-CoA carboxylase carboxyl transferase subunit alpha/beta [Candidatus Neomarinimicrobiota bacterium]MBT3999701.1 acetyl-CoA carboxylase carboxyl transferase subunit alpha/beta [Candidatus Neomarinimicrobiota bacterium]MBT4282470.1 acetyl-CoA carboxylase carboxyl transferase subunit alpha/beta [Candidatus Neomarinimicrobiota bacterium]MBT4579784.1 acetyl-CoA carboxylase c